MNHTRRRRLVAGTVLLVLAAILILVSPDNYQTTAPEPSRQPEQGEVLPPDSALAALENLAVKGRASTTGYSRSQFGPGWLSTDGCDMRNRILARDLTNIVTDHNCRVISGTLLDPYSGKTIQFLRGELTSPLVQIDHVVALSDAWQKGAQQLSLEQRIAFSNDPLELLAVDGMANEQKSNGDAATWLPSNKAFRCQYVARQVAVKQKYSLWVTQAEKEAIKRVLRSCPGQPLPAGFVG